jgi:hypothetical protein
MFVTVAEEGFAGAEPLDIIVRPIPFRLATENAHDT